jgi:hypothetical protein
MYPILRLAFKWPNAILQQTVSRVLIGIRHADHASKSR